MKRIVYSAHAHKRLHQRNISRQQVKETLDEPEITMGCLNPKLQRVKRKFGGKYLDVIFEKQANCIVIVTVQWPEGKGE